MPKFNDVGVDWLLGEIDELPETIEHVKPSIFNEQNRYLPESVTSMPGFIRYDVNPFMREIIDCFDIDSPVREVNVKKGVQITYTTALESGVLYYMGHVKNPSYDVTLLLIANWRKLVLKNNFISNDSTVRIF